MAAPAGNSPFEEIKEQDTVKDVFNVAFKRGLPVTFWLRDKLLQFEAKIASFNKERVYIELPHFIREEDWDAAYAKAKEGDAARLFGTVSMQKTTFFLKLLINERELRTVKCYYPMSVFKLQRRQNFRARMSYAKPTFITVTGKEYRLIDISVGGMSFAAPVDEASRFAAETKLADLSFRLLAREVRADATVKHVMRTQDEAKKDILKVGLQVTKMLPEQEKIVADYVAQETRNLFSAI